MVRVDEKDQNIESRICFNVSERLAAGLERQGGSPRSRGADPGQPTLKGRLRNQDLARQRGPASWQVRAAGTISCTVSRCPIGIVWNGLLNTRGA
jgi:hypothetical protein